MAFGIEVSAHRRRPEIELLLSSDRYRASDDARDDTWTRRRAFTWVLFGCAAFWAVIAGCLVRVAG